MTGISLTIGFAILIIGIPFALLFIGSIRVLSHVEGRIVEGLLGVRMPRRLPPATQADETIWARIKDGLADSRTWSSMFYFLLKLPLGVAYFVIAVVGLSVSLGVTAGCIYSLITNDASHIHVDEAPCWSTCCTPRRPDRVRAGGRAAVLRRPARRARHRLAARPHRRGPSGPALTPFVRTKRAPRIVRFAALFLHVGAGHDARSSRNPGYR